MSPVNTRSDARAKDGDKSEAAGSAAADAMAAGPTNPGTGSRLEASATDGIREVSSSGAMRTVSASEVMGRMGDLAARAEAAERELAMLREKMTQIGTNEALLQGVAAQGGEVAEGTEEQTKKAQAAVAVAGATEHPKQPEAPTAPEPPKMTTGGPRMGEDAAIILRELQALSSRMDKMEGSQGSARLPERKAPSGIQERDQAGTHTTESGRTLAHDGLSTRDLVKLYQRSLSHVTVSKVLDPKFPALRAAWTRMRTLYPLQWSVASSLLSHGFKDRAAVVYEEVVARNMTAEEEELWELLERRLYNSTQVETIRSDFEGIRWKDEESVTDYADRLRELASCLPDVLSEQALCSRFINGLPRAMRSQVVLADTGSLDSLVATTARLAAIQGTSLTGGNRRERLLEIQEDNQAVEGPPGCSTNPVGPSQGRKPYPPHRNLKCYRCNRFGHVAKSRVARDTGSAAVASEKKEGKAHGPANGEETEPRSCDQREDAGEGREEPDREDSTIEQLAELAEELLQELGHSGSEEEGDGEELDSCVVKVRTKLGKTEALIDTGAYSSWISESLFKTLTDKSPDPEPEGTPRVSAADGRPITNIKGRGTVPLALWGRPVQVAVRVVRDLPSGLILGRRFMRQQGVVLDFDLMRGYFSSRRKGARPRTHAGKLYTPREETLAEVSLLTANDEDVETEIRELDLSGLGEEEDNLRSLLLEYADVFKGLGRVKDREFKIEIETDGSIDLDVPARRLSPKEKEVERREVQKMIEAGVLERSTATASTVNVFVDKKTVDKEGRPEIRTTSDMRRLNSVTRSMRYPLPNITQITEWLATKKVFSCLDLTSGYWSVPLHKDSRRLTAVKTVLGVLQYVRMVMGLKNSAAFFQQLMDSILAELNWKVAVAYQDDVSVGSESPAEHVEHLRQTLERLRDAGMKIRLSKCQFAQVQVDVLGFKVRHGRISPSDNHVKNLSAFPEPEDAHSLLRFLGILSFLSRFVDNLSQRAAPLYDVLKDSGWNKKKKKRQAVKIQDFDKRWGQVQRNAFEDLRDAVGPNILTAPCQGAKKRLVTDASSVGYGAVLLQWEGQGAPDEPGDGEVNEGWQPIIFLSRSLKGGEPRWTTTERECGAVVWALQKLKVYLQGEPFDVCTDHTALLWLMTCRDARPRLARWIMCVQEYVFDVKHVPGRSAVMAAPDALSRDFVNISDVVTCTRCKDVLATIAQLDEAHEKEDLLQRVKQAQRAEYGNLEREARRNTYLLTDEGALAKVHMGLIRVVVPKGMRREVVETIHQGRVRGHWGVSRTAAVVAGSYWWPGWLTTVQEVVGRCTICLAARRVSPLRTGPMRVYAPTRRNQFVACDILTITPQSEGRTKLLVIGELLSRFVVVTDVVDERATTIAKTLMQAYISVFGPPETLVMDNGLHSEVVKEVCSILGTKCVTTLPHHPHGNGMVERYNRTLLADLRKLVLWINKGDLTSWKSLVSLSALRYNTTQHRVTGMTPYKAMFGTDILPLEFTATANDLEQKEEDEQALAPKLRAIECLVSSKTRKDREQTKLWYDQHLAAEQQFTPGQHVFLHYPQDENVKGRKLQHAWRPQQIIQKVGTNSYLLQGPDGSVTRSHVDRVRVAPQVDPAQHILDPHDVRLKNRIVGTATRDGIAGVYISSRGRTGRKWVPAADLSTSLRSQLSREGRLPAPDKGNQSG